MSNEDIVSHLTSKQIQFINIVSYLSDQLQLLDNPERKEKIEELIFNLNHICDLFNNIILAPSTDALRIYSTSSQFAIAFQLADQIEPLIAENHDFMTINVKVPHAWDRLVNALKKISSAVRISYSSVPDIQELPLDVIEYLSIGEALKDTPEIQAIKRTLQSELCFDIYTSPSMFASIIGPSYMGKTQSAFALMHILNVMYVNFCPIVAMNEECISVQEIYSPFARISKIFYNCLLCDYKKFSCLSSTA